MHSIFEANEKEAILLVDTETTFDSINQEVPRCNVQNLCLVSAVGMEPTTPFIRSI